MFHIVLIVLFVLVYLFKLTRKSRLTHIPGPRGIPFFGNSLQLDPHAPRLTFMKWFEQYGACYKVRILTGDVVVLSGLDTIYEALVTKGKQFRDRPCSFRLEYIQEKIFTFGPADARWKALRMVSQRHIKQFGEGIAPMEKVIKEVTDDMMAIFKGHVGVHLDPWEAIRNVGMNTIVIFIMGQKLLYDDPLMNKLTQYAAIQIFLLSHAGPSFLLIDMFPFLINFPLKSSKMMKYLKKMEVQLWKEIKQRQESSEKSLTKQLLDDADSTCSDQAGKPQGITEAEARLTALLMITAGVNTTAYTFYGLVNTLAHRQDIQDKLHKQIEAVMPGQKDELTVTQKPSLPYVQATLLETTRFFTLLPGGVLHGATKDTELTGYGVIPKGTPIMINLWALHHDKAFWGDPEIFRPERFLDENGECVLADNPKRKHLLAFSAGPRVCLGETFAQTRLFIWTVAMVHQFKISPAEGNDPSWLSPVSHGENLLLQPTPYQVLFEHRF